MTDRQKLIDEMVNAFVDYTGGFGEDDDRRVMNLVLDTIIDTLPTLNVVEVMTQAWLESASDYKRLDQSMAASLNAMVESLR